MASRIGLLMASHIGVALYPPGDASAERLGARHFAAERETTWALTHHPMAEMWTEFDRVSIDLVGACRSRRPKSESEIVALAPLTRKGQSCPAKI
jgi:hypothetical protein